MWVLIVFMAIGYTGSSHTVEFTTRQGCLTAIEHLERDPKASRRMQVAICIPKD